MNECEQLEAMKLDLELACKRIKELEDALSELIDVQNGPPLVQHADEWRTAMKQAHTALFEEWDA